MKKTMKDFRTFVKENYTGKIKESHETEVVKDTPDATKIKKRIVTNPSVTTKVTNAYNLLRKKNIVAASSAEGKGGFTFIDKSGKEVSVKLKGGDILKITVDGKAKEINYTALLSTLEPLTGVKLK